MIGYSRAQTLAEKAVLPVTFGALDGEASWRDEEGVELGPHRLAGAYPEETTRPALFTALRTGFAEALLREGKSGFRLRRAPDAPLISVDPCRFWRAIPALGGSAAAQGVEAAGRPKHLPEDRDTRETGRPATAAASVFPTAARPPEKSTGWYRAEQTATRRRVAVQEAGQPRKLSTTPRRYPVGSTEVGVGNAERSAVIPWGMPSTTTRSN